MRVPKTFKKAISEQEDDMQDGGKVFQNTFDCPSWQIIWQIPKTYSPEILQPYEKLCLNKNISRGI